MSSLRARFGAIGLLLLASHAAHAGQLRVTVSSNNFTPRTANVGLFDHVVWVWTGGSHSATSGDSLSGIGDGTFDSGLVGTTTTGPAFDWHANGTGTFPYFCVVHAPPMAGRVIVGSGANSVSDFRITEVQFNVPGNQDLLEITNMGAAGDLALYRLKIAGTGVTTLQIAASNKNIAVGAGAHVVLHFNVSGVNTATDLFFPSLVNGLPATGSVALYVPNTITPNLASADQIIDYVEWGASGQENEGTAASALLWSAGTSVSNVAAGHSIEFCGTSGQYGIAHWAEISTPNFGSTGGCVTPNLRTTWGRVKSLYR